jgi:hypothetical protein
MALLAPHVEQLIPPLIKKAWNFFGAKSTCARLTSVAHTPTGIVKLRLASPLVF